MRLTRFLLLAALLPISILTGPAEAQTTTAGPATTPVETEMKKGLDIDKTDDSRPLFEEREILIERLTVLDKEIADLSAEVKSLPSLTTIENNLKTAERDLERAKTAKVQDQARIELVTQYRDNALKDRDTVETFTPKLEESSRKRDTTARRLFRVEQRIASLFDAARDTNRFRTSVTYTFGVLVFFVIVGFYMIAWQKEGIAKTIFAGEMGMQFVTLFLIVIAIILFGIMGTLEGKELAALLGGLSGYILGRSSQPKNGPAPAASAGGTSPEQAQ